MRYNTRQMVELYKRIAALALLGCVLVCTGGCETIAKILSSDNNESLDVAPVYFEPRVRPGIALIVVVGSGATKPDRKSVV